MIIKIPDYITVILFMASLILGTSLLNYKLIAKTNARLVIKGKDITEWYIVFLTRLMVVSLTMISISIISIFVSGRTMEIIIAVIGLVSFVLMFNIERLPIWEEEN